MSLDLADNQKHQALWLICLFCCTTLLVNNTSAQGPSIQWQKAFGGTAHDYAFAISETFSNGVLDGYIAGGVSYSKDGNVTGNHGSSDLWVVRLRNDFSIAWQKSLGGGQGEKGTLVYQTADKGFIVGGTTASSNGDVKGYHGGGGDIWIAKLSANGSLQWQRALGGSGLDEIVAVQELPGGDFIVGGKTASTNGDVTGNHGGTDLWVVRLTSLGSIAWKKTYGSPANDDLHQLLPTPDGGFILAARITAKGGDITTFYGSVDLWIVKLKSNGDLEWQKTLGGSGLENLVSLRMTKDGGYIVGTDTDAGNGTITGTPNQRDMWVAKLNASGGLSWQTLLTAPGYAMFHAVEPTSDGGYIVGGSSADNDPQTTGGIMLCKLTGTGAISWMKEYGGSGSDEIYFLQQTSDGGFVTAGPTQSKEISGYQGGTDTWLLKVKSDGALQWAKAYGGSKEDWHLAGNGSLHAGRTLFSAILPHQKIQASDGGYFFSVSTTSSDGDVSGYHKPRSGTTNDIWIVKLSPEGTSGPVTSKELIPEAETLFSAQAYPNPFTAQTTIRFTATASGTATIDLYHANGARVKTAFSANVKAGERYTITLQDALLPKGVYFYRLRNGKNILSGRLVKN